jgi:hypothetical protein
MAKGDQGGYEEHVGVWPIQARLSWADAAAGWSAPVRVGLAAFQRHRPAARARTVLRWINRLVPVSGTFLHLIDRICYQAVGLAVDLVGGPGIRCLD